MKKGVWFLWIPLLLFVLGGCSDRAAPAGDTTTTVTTTTATATTTGMTATTTTATTTTTVTTTTRTTVATTAVTHAPAGVRETIHGKEWLLTFYDDFDGTTLDTTKWDYCPNWFRDDCVWTDDHAVVDGSGNLRLKVSGDAIPYAAGAIRTRGLFEQTYGYFEVRCQMTPIAGICSAFWLMCDGAGQVGTPGGSDGAEIDVIEAPMFADGKVQHALHWDGYGDWHGTTDHAMVRPDLYEGFHTYGLEWNESEYIFYIDGEETWRTHSGGVCAVPVYMKLTLGIGGWTGALDASELPVDGMVIDYVKAYTAA